MSRVILLSLVVLVATAFAQDAPKDAQAATRAAFAEMQTHLAEARAVAQDVEKRKAAVESFQAAQEKFRAAFTESDWDKWDPVADKDLLLQGLSMIGNKALQDGDGNTAVRAFETLSAKFPELASRYIGMLASAHASVNGFEKAFEFVTKAVETTEQDQRPAALVLRGDYKAAAGDAAGARKDWEAAIAEIPAETEPRKDLRGRTKAEAEFRLAYVGKPAPEIAAQTWLDGETKPLSALKGSVVLVDFWATWCPPCRQVMPSLDELYKEKKQSGLIVLGVTHFYPNGFLPKAGTKDPLRDGEQLRGITEETFLDHVKQFKSNVGLSYPFAIATAAEFKAYGITGIPTLVVVGRDGNVAFLKVGGGDEALLKTAVERQLGSKASG